MICVTWPKAGDIAIILPHTFAKVLGLILQQFYKTMDISSCRSKSFLSGTDKVQLVKFHTNPSHSNDWTGVQIDLSLFGTKPELIKSFFTWIACLLLNCKLSETPKPSSKYKINLILWLLQNFTKGLKSFEKMYALDLSPKGKSVKTNILQHYLIPS